MRRARQGALAARPGELAPSGRRWRKSIGMCASIWRAQLNATAAVVVIFQLLAPLSPRKRDQLDLMVWRRACPSRPADRLEGALVGAAHANELGRVLCQVDWMR